MNLEKLREVLSEQGIDPEKIESIIAEMESDGDENGAEPIPVPAEPEVVPEEPSEPIPEPAPKDETEGDPAPAEIPPVEEVPLAEEGNFVNDPELAAIITGADEGVPGEPVPQEPVEPELPQQPPVDPALLEQVQEQQKVIDEQKAALEGLSARIESLEQALRGAGVLEDGGASVDEGNPSTPKPIPANNPVDDPMEDVLARINGHRF